MGPTGTGKSTVSFFRFNFSQFYLLNYLLSLLIKLLELKTLRLKLESAIIWHLVLIKFKLSVAPTGNKIVR